MDARQELIEKVAEILKSASLQNLGDNMTSRYAKTVNKASNNSIIAGGIMPKLMKKDLQNTVHRGKVIEEAMK